MIIIHQNILTNERFCNKKIIGGIIINLENDFDSYLYGLILSDGSIYLDTRNRGKVTIELKYECRKLIEQIQEKLSYKSSIRYRKRDTNFKLDYKCIVWTCCELSFRNELFKFGMPQKDKSYIADIPKVKYNIGAFWRGYIDGNGSVGFTKNDEPFISLTIVSEKLKTKYLKFLEDQFDIIKIINRNNRDGVYNIIVKNEDAINLGCFIYKEATIYIQEKYDKYLEFASWKRIKKKIHIRRWSKFEDNFILNHTTEESVVKLNRTNDSIKTRLWRLKNNSNFELKEEIS